MQYISWLFLSVLLVVNFNVSPGLPVEDFFPYGEGTGDKVLPQKDEGATREIDLAVPFIFYGDNYFSLFVNVNGIISFLTEIPYFFNSQFPLDYPVIAPFYSDVDISGTGNVYYRETSDPVSVERVAQAVEEFFEEGDGFEPESVFVATWDAVGSYQSRRDKVNTFQVVLATDRRDSYVIFNYADGGLQWLQGDGKTSGLPDALGQAGLIAADGRLFTIKGSGTDQVRNLDKWSNVGKPGMWMFRVGRIYPGKNIDPPNNHPESTSLDLADSYQKFFLDGSSCSSGGSVCHSSAICNDYETGFCCSCEEGFYGNGINCLSNEKPIRVTGKLSGSINGIEILEADLHSYVLSLEGRTYTAVSRVPIEVGYDLQSLTAIGEGIAWLFAVPKEGISNGFILTGGSFNRTVDVEFPQTGHKATVEQSFEGLDVFNNVAVNTRVKGSLPTVPIGSELSIDAFSEEFTRVKTGQMRAHSSRTFKLKGQTLETPYTVKTIINFNECQHSQRDTEFDTLRMKVAENIFIRFDEAEAIVRYSFSAKIGTLEEEDPCLQGREECGPNSQCIVDRDTFRCVCEQGYDYVLDTTRNAHICLDINECDIGRDLCDVNAVCINSEGSYACQCRSGYAGDGYYCNPEITCHNAGCDPNASCQEIHGQPECECNIGYKGDGFFCTPDFGDDSCHIVQNCSPYAFCAPTGNGYECQCLQGYRGDGYTCDVDRVIVEGDFFGQEDQRPDYLNQPPTPRPLDTDDRLTDDSYQSEPERIVYQECIQEFCWCPQGYDFDEGNGYCVDSASSAENLDSFESEAKPEPICDHSLRCTCPEGFVYNAIYNSCDDVSEAPPCNVVNNCHPDAQCLYNSNTGESECSCHAGFTGDGFFCTPGEVACDVVNTCHFHADCIYDDTNLKSVCVCKPGYVGDGFVCTPQDDCNSAADCNPNAECQFHSLSQRYVCQCHSGFEGDGFYCSAIEEADSCVTLQNCDPNADCVYDSYSQNYRCQCREGYEGDGTYCLQIELSCDIVNNCDRNADCTFDPNIGGFECKCRQGFSGDGVFCIRVQSCLNDPTMCDPNAICQRSSADEYIHECACLPGFNGDGITCQEVPEHDKNILILNQGLSVLRMPTDPNAGTGFPIHMDPYMTAVGADIDCIDGVYYWTDVGSRSIRSSNYDGSNRRPVLSGEKIGYPEDVAIDWVTKNIFWTDSANDVVTVADLSTIDETYLIRTVIEGNLVNPRGITLHPGLGLLFWSDWNRDNPKIEKSGMDGSERETLVSGLGVSLPNSLVIDFETSTLCWADAGTHRIECIGIQGYGRRIVIEGVKYPFGLSLHKDSFFYTDWNDTRVHEVGRYTGIEGEARIPPLGGSGKLYGIAAVPNRCPPVSNVCKVSRGNCPSSHLCLPNGRGGRSCVCPSPSSSSSSSQDDCSDFNY